MNQEFHTLKGVPHKHGSYHCEWWRIQGWAGAPSSGKLSHNFYWIVGVILSQSPPPEKRKEKGIEHSALEEIFLVQPPIMNMGTQLFIYIEFCSF